MRMRDLHIRLPEDTYADLTKLARRDMRSLSNEAGWLIACGIIRELQHTTQEGDT